MNVGAELALPNKKRTNLVICHHQTASSGDFYPSGWKLCDILKSQTILPTLRVGYHVGVELALPKEGKPRFAPTTTFRAQPTA